MATVDITLAPEEIERIAAAVAAKLRPELAKTTASATAGENGQNGRLLWSEREAAGRFGLSPHTLKTWRQEGLIPCHSSKPVRYSRDDLDAILDFLRTRDDTKQGD